MPQKITTARVQQLADAYVLVGKADHYMVGIITSVTDDELLATYQILITRENEAGTKRTKALRLALDCIESDLKKRRIL